MVPKVKNNEPIDQATDAGVIRKQKDNRPPQKRKISAYEGFYNTMHAGLKSPAALLDTFMREAELMETYKGYGQEQHEEINFICRRFEVAFNENDIDLMVDLYENLESIKLQMIQPSH